MSNNPEQDKEIYEKAIDYMNKAQKVSKNYVLYLLFYKL